MARWWKCDLCKTYEKFGNFGKIIYNVTYDFPDCNNFLTLENNKISNTDVACNN
jgi:hypothetical protein